MNQQFFKMSKMSLKGGVEKGHLLHLNVKLSFKIDFMSMVLTYASGFFWKIDKKRERFSRKYRVNFLLFIFKQLMHF